MRILFIGTYLSNKLGSKGPTETIAEELRKTGLKVELASKAKTPFVRFLETVKLILLNKYDMVILDVYSSRVLYLTWFYSKCLQLRRQDYSCTLHGGALKERWPSIKKTLKSVLKESVFITSPSKFLQSFFNDLNFNIKYLPNPVDRSIFHFSKKTGKLNSPIKLLWVRAFTSIYQPELAILCIEELKKLKIPAKLTMIGPDKGSLANSQKLIAFLGLTNEIEIIGPVPNNKLVSYYHNHDILINTTLYESFGMAVVEAASCGLPVVSTRVGELKFSWEDGYEIIFADNSAESFAQAIRNLVTDLMKYEQVSYNAMKKAQEFEKDLIKEKWIQSLNA